jgi:hypothetical protein
MATERSTNYLQLIYKLFIFGATKTMENWHEQKLLNLAFSRKLNSRSKPNTTSNPTSNPLIPMIHNLQNQ